MSYEARARALYPTSATKPGEHVRPGDVILFLGTPHLVSRVEPYDFCGACGIARAADGWGITLFPGHPIPVA